MSDFCLKCSNNPDESAQGGFTLIEMLVVLTLVGLMTAFSLPQFGVIRDRLTYTLNRDSFEREVASLSYLAFKEGHPLLLAGQYPRSPEDKRTPLERLQEADGGRLTREPGQLRPLWPVNITEASLTLPEDWRASIDRPIIYAASGFCDGGAITLFVGQSRYTYDLKAPTCQVQVEK